VRDETGRIEDFTFVDLNSNGEKLISMPKEEVIGKRLCELLPINPMAAFFQKYVRVVETGVAFEEEFPICEPGVNASWLHHQVVPLADGVAITSRDITERKLAEEALRESEERLRLTLEAAHLTSWDHNIQTGRVIFSSVNREGQSNLVLKTFSITYETFLERVHPEDREFVRQK
jgi:PAS domain S-box-containing protein